MGAQQSKEEFLYQQVNYGNIEGIKALHRDGAGLEWINEQGITPLMLACMRPDLIDVAKVLIELGANVRAYRPGSFAGTALHHAAKRGLYQTVNLLLSGGANPFLINDDCHTPLDLARSKGHCSVVRTMEGHICLFCGWMRELYGPSIIEAFAPQWVQRKIWAVVIPCDYRNPTRPQKFELAIYPDLQAAQPREVIQLWKAEIEVPKLSQPDPAVIIVDKDSKTRHKLLSGKVGDKRQLQWFYNACQGLSQAPPTMSVLPSAPPLDESFNGPVQYPMIDSTPVDLNMPDVAGVGKGEDKKNGSGSSGVGSDSGSCVICLDAPVEGACIPCGHMAGCMSCLNDIKRKSWGCPVCRADIDQVVRLYAV